MRVGVRRLRSTLRTFEPLCARSWADPLTRGAALAGRRARRRTRGGGAPGAAAPHRERRPAGRPRRCRRRPDRRRAGRPPRGGPDRARRGARVPALPGARQHARLHGRDPAADPDRRSPGRASCCPGWSSARGTGWRTASTASTAPATSTRPRPDRQWHAVRIRAKRARYAADATTVVLGPRARAFASALADVVDVLGAHQDAVVAAQTWLRDRGLRPGRPRARGHRRAARRTGTRHRPSGSSFLPRHVASRRKRQTDSMAATKLIRSAGGVFVWREGHRDRDRAPRPLRRLVAAEGQARPGRTRARRRGPGGARGDRSGRRAAVRLPTVTYLTGEPDTEKSVDFWSMQALSEAAFTANDEISGLRWLAVDAADELLTYAHDRGVVAAFAALQPITGVVVLVRHAQGRLPGEPGPATTTCARSTRTASARPRRSRRCCRCSSRPGSTRRRSTAASTRSPRSDCRCVTTPCSPRRPRPSRKRSPTGCGRSSSEHGRVVVCQPGRRDPGRHRGAAAAERDRGRRRFATPKGSGWVLSFAGTDLVAADPAQRRKAPPSTASRHRPFRCTAGAYMSSRVRRIE